MMRIFAAFFFAVSLITATDAFACNASFCPNDPSAVIFDASTGLHSPSISNLPDSGSSVLISFWYNNLVAPTSGATNDTVFYASGADAQEPQVYVFMEDCAQVSSTGATLVVQIIRDTNGLSSMTPHVIQYGAGGCPGPFPTQDPNWHHVIVSINNVAATIAVDLDGSPVGNLSVGLVSGQAPGPIQWSLMKNFSLGGQPGDALLEEFNGGLAELFIYVNSDVPLTAGLVSKFYSGGKAVGLGPNCTAPTGSVPNMCNRGDPCDFIFGPKPNSAPNYILKRPAGSSQPLLNGADTDPCLTPGNGQGCAPNR